MTPDDFTLHLINLGEASHDTKLACRDQVMK